MTGDPFVPVLPDIYVPSVLVPWEEAQKGDDAVLVDFGLRPSISERDLAVEARTVVRGAPGSGKSALLREIGRVVPKDERPLLIPLAFVRPAQGSPDVLLQRWLRSAGTDAHFNADTRLHLLFDGLDELPPEEQQRYAEAIVATAERFPEHRMTVASRPIPALETFTPPWKTFQLSPGSNWQEAFLAAYDVTWSDLVQRFPGISAASGLLRLPFFLKTVVYLYRTGEGEAADLWALVQALTTRALSRDVEPVALPLDTAHAWLRRVAFAMRLVGRSTIQLGEAEKISAPDGEIVGNAATICEALVQRSMLRQEGDEYSFIHRIIGESLAAEVLSELEPDEDLLDAIVPVVEGVDASVRDDWLVPLIFLGAREPRWREAVARRDQLSAARLVPRDATVEERRTAARTIWRQYVEWRIWLFRYDASELLEDGRILIRHLEGGGIGDVVAEVERGLSSDASQTRVNAIQVLAPLRSAKLRENLGRLLHDDDVVVRRYAGVAAETLGAVEVLPELQERLLTTSEDTEEQDLSYGAFALTPDDQLEGFAREVLERKPGSHVAWRAEREIRRRLGPEATLRFLQQWAKKQRTPILIDEQRDVVALALAAGETSEAVAMAAYLIAAWDLVGEREHEFVNAHPREAWDGMRAAIADGVAYDFDVVRYVRAFPLELLEATGAPDLLLQWRRESQADEADRVAPQQRRPMPKPAPARPELEDLLQEPREASDAQLLKLARILKAEVSRLSGLARGELRDRLESWWPEDGVTSAVTFADSDSWTMSYGLSAWLEYGPAIDMPLSASRWAELASSGVIYGEQAEWLCRHWTPDGLTAVLDRLPTAPARIWVSVLRASPAPLNASLAEAVAERTVVGSDDDRHAAELGQRLVAGGAAPAAKRLVERHPVFRSGILPHLALAGDQESVAQLLDALVEGLRDGEASEFASAEWIDTRNVEWLEGARDPVLLPRLFAALRADVARGSPRFGPSAAIERAIARVDGADAVRAYDNLMMESKVQGVQFVRYARDAIAINLLRRHGIAAAPEVLKRIGLPVLESSLETLG